VQLAYATDAPHSFIRIFPGEPLSGIAALTGLGEGRVLVLERAGCPGLSPFENRIYLVNTSDATDITGVTENLATQFEQHVGKELLWNAIRNLGVRGGYCQVLANADSGQFTVGASAKAEQWQLDYAYQAGMSAEMVELLVRELELEPGDVSYHATILDLTCLFQLASLQRPELKDSPWPPVTAGRIAAADDAERSIFSVIRERPLLVHHPYESFASSVESFIAQAADDPKVQSIKMTMYRAGGDSALRAVRPGSLVRAGWGVQNNVQRTTPLRDAPGVQQHDTPAPAR
jgi:hypothetical protein